jgi:RHS repeat-associated protein
MTVVNFDWDEIEDNIDQEFDGVGNSLAEYTTEPDLYGNVVSQYRDGVTSTFHHDAIGSTIAVTNDAGDVTDTIDFSAFGESTHRTGTTVFPFQFVGQKGYYRDAETGDNCVRRREYRPVIARWLCQDPISFNGVGGEYVYANQRPVTLLDASGLAPDPPGTENIILTPLHDAPIAVDCGKDWKQQWRLALPVDSPCDGYFVQKVEKHCVTQHCPFCVGSCLDLSSTPRHVYYEAFGLHKRGMPAGTSAQVDTFSVKVPKSECYSENTLGEVRFYCNEGEVAAAIPNWKPFLVVSPEECASFTTSELAPATRDKPKFWDDDLDKYLKNYSDAYVGFHYLISVSVCCDGKPNSFARATWETKTDPKKNE